MTETIINWISEYWLVALTAIATSTAVQSPLVFYILRIINNKRTKAIQEEQRVQTQSQLKLHELEIASINKVFQAVELMLRAQGSRKALEQLTNIKKDFLTLNDEIKEQLTIIVPSSRLLKDKVEEIPVLLKDTISTVKEVVNEYIDTNKIIR